MTFKNCLIVVFLACLICSGCASRAPREDVRKQMDLLSQKYQVSQKENDLLKKELALCRDIQNIDIRHFFEVRDLFEKVLEPEILRKNVWLFVSDRGLVITVSAERVFISGGNMLSDDGRAFLDLITAIIQKEFPQNYVFVEGHTDNQSLVVFEWKSDWDFSFARALSVVQYLQSRGIDPLRLSAVGFGRYRPRATNDSKEGRRLNRRIEIVVSPQKVGQITPKDDV
ncbi:MAG: OmpA family protein [Candidatus Omnitrophota bacterium]